MPILLPDQSVISVNFDGRANGQQILLTTHWRLSVDGGATDPDMDELFTAVDTFWRTPATGLYDTYAGCLNVTTTVPLVWFQAIHPTRYVRVPFPGPATGLVVEGELPQNVAAVCTLQTDAAGRTEVANKHIGGIPDTFVTDGLITVAGKAAINSLAASLKTTQTVTIGAFDYDLVPLIFHRANPALSPVITRGYAQDTSRVMRRRTVGQGS